MAKHIGIVACSAEGAALCYRTICTEAPKEMGEYAHPEVTMHTHPLSAYMKHIWAGEWKKVAELMLSSAQKVAEAGADLEARDDAGRTVLREAATMVSWSEVGGSDLIDFLVSAGADVNAREDNGRTILGWAEFRATVDPIYSKIADALRAHDALN